MGYVMYARREYEPCRRNYAVARREYILSRRDYDPLRRDYFKKDIVIGNIRPGLME